MTRKIAQKKMTAWFAGAVLVACGTYLAAQGRPPGYDYGPVMRGDTLWRISKMQTPRVRGATMAQMVMAIFWANPQAFAGSPHVLRTGVYLKIPAIEQVLATDKRVAKEYYLGQRPYLPPPQSARRAAEVVASRDERLRDTAEGLAILDLASGQPANDVYEQLAPLERRFAGDPEYSVLLGNAALGSGRVSEAVFALMRAVALDPGAAEPRVSLARAHCELGDAEAARREVQHLDAEPQGRARCPARWHLFGTRRTAAVGAPPPREALAAGDAARIVFAQGKVEVERGTQLLGARRGMPLRAGDHIASRPGGRVQIRFNDGALLEMQPDTRMAIPESPPPAANGSPGPSAITADDGRLLRLFNGGFRSYGSAVCAQDHGCTVVTPVAVLRVKGADYSLAYCLGDCPGGRADGLYAGVHVGQAVLSNPFGSVELGGHDYAHVADVNVAPERQAAAHNALIMSVPPLPPPPAPAEGSTLAEPPAAAQSGPATQPVLPVETATKSGEALPATPAGSETPAP